MIGTSSAGIMWGVGLGLCFYEPKFLWLMWITLIPFAWILTAPPSGVLYASVFVGGTIYHFLSLDFVRGAYAGQLFWTLISLSLVASCFWVIGVFAAKQISPRMPTLMSVTLPIIWVSLEFLRLHFSDFLIDLPVSHAQIGILAVQYTALVQIADLGGGYAVAWVIACVNGALFDFLRAVSAGRRQPRLTWNATCSVCLASITLGSAWLYGAWRLSQSPVELGPRIILVPETVEGNIDDVEADRFIQLTESTVDDLATANGYLFDRQGIMTLFVWPEGSYRWPSTLERSSRTYREVEAFVRDLSRRLGGAVIIGCSREEDVPHGLVVRSFNSLAFATPHEGFQGWYDKIVLVPWREHQPAVAAALNLLPTSQAGGLGGPFQKGSRPCIFRISNGNKAYAFGTFICVEVACPGLFREYMSNSVGHEIPDFFVGCAYESAFSDSRYADISADCQRLRAIECRRSFARVAFNGVSSIVDGNGQVVSRQIPLADAGFVGGRIPIDRRYSLYVAWGDWLPVLSCLAVIYFAAMPRRCRKQERHRAPAGS